VRYGHDTDTTAAIAGGLAGLRWSLDEREGGIPAEWLSGLRGQDVVGPLLGRIVTSDWCLSTDYAGLARTGGNSDDTSSASTW
jgi:hypothetical protein